ncbi:MAG: HAD-IIA family hydrolase [Magnetococcales bacterium]|nr:HAD-IIA family hydrolase [Magnetococcales bacterium]
MMSRAKPVIHDQEQLTPDYARYRTILCDIDTTLDGRLRGGTMKRTRFSEIAGQFDTLFFDAFGVLNRGRSAIDGAPQRLDALRQAGATMRVVSNNASQSPAKLVRRFAEMGFEIPLHEIVSSGMAVHPFVAESRFENRPYLLVGSQDSREAYAPDPQRLMVDDTSADDWKRAEYILMCSNKHFYEADQHKQCLRLLKEHGASVLLANPDMVAPDVNDGIYAVAGYTTARLLDETPTAPLMGIGKPFAPIFELALSTLDPATDPKCILMVGDTLDTDILGGAAMGFSTCLTLSGVYAGQGNRLEELCEIRGIRPDFVVNSIAD